MHDAHVNAYLARIGADRPDRPGLEGLRALQRAHLATVPFENLSIHLGEPIELDETALLAKIVDRRRGGFCYELNGAFAALLTALGYEVELLAARVFQEGEPGPPMDHLALRVTLDGRPWLVDVGFGRFSGLPLRLDTAEPQQDPEGTFAVVERPEGLDVLRDGTPEYRLDPRPLRLDDFRPTCWWQATWPGSHFRRYPMSTLLSAEGRITLVGHRLIRTADGSRLEEDVPDTELLAAYRAHFGLELDRLPAGPVHG